jgi:hypothetical protein
MVSFEDVRAARPAAVVGSARAWIGLARQLRGGETRTTTGLTGALRGSGWRGEAADAALRHLDELDDEFELAARQATVVAAVLDRFAEQLADIQKQIQIAVGNATGYEMRVRSDGSVEPAPLTVDEKAESDGGLAAQRRKAEHAEFFAEVITEQLGRASKLDYDVSGVLQALEPLVTGDLTDAEWDDALRDAGYAAEALGLKVSQIPDRHTSPQTVANWWNGLSTADQTLYAAAFPAAIGALHGLPAAVRHDANVLVLRDHIVDTRRDMGGRGQQHRERDLERSRRLLDMLEASETGPAEKRLMLLGVDNTGDGKAIVAVGNPDTAAHTAVFVPGVGSTLDGMDGLVNRATTIQGLADDLTPGRPGDVAVVAWLDYSAPDVDDEAYTDFESQRGGKALDQFIDGLRVSHEPGATHVTAIGHSYGSTVVGEAASRGNGLAVDDIVTAGSPGMNVGHVSDLNVDARHVWAGAAHDDPIAGTAGSIPSVHDSEPTDRDFGANRYHVDTGGHSGYWKHDSRSLLNQAAVVVGQYGDVTLDHGKAPR